MMPDLMKSTSANRPKMLIKDLMKSTSSPRPKMLIKDLMKATSSSRPKLHIGEMMEDVSKTKIEFENDLITLKLNYNVRNSKTKPTEIDGVPRSYSLSAYIMGMSSTLFENSRRRRLGSRGCNRL